MKIRYDDKTDAMYIQFNEERSYHMSKKITDDVVVDYSKDRQVIGVEILDASQNILLSTSQQAVAIEKAQEDSTTEPYSLPGQGIKVSSIEDAGQKDTPF